MIENSEMNTDELPLDTDVVDSVLRSLALPFSRRRLASGEVTLSEIMERLKHGGRDTRFLRLYKERIQNRNQK